MKIDIISKAYNVYRFDFTPVDELDRLFYHLMDREVRGDDTLTLQEGDTIDWKTYYTIRNQICIVIDKTERLAVDGDMARAYLQCFYCEWGQIRSDRRELTEEEYSLHILIEILCRQYVTENGRSTSATLPFVVSTIQGAYRKRKIDMLLGVTKGNEHKS